MRMSIAEILIGVIEKFENDKYSAHIMISGRGGPVLKFDSNLQFPPLMINDMLEFVVLSRIHGSRRILVPEEIYGARFLAQQIGENRVYYDGSSKFGDSEPVLFAAKALLYRP